MKNSTTYTNKCSILADLWLNYRSKPEFDELRSYSDLGLPLAYAIDNEIVESTEKAQKFIEETFEMLLATLEVDDDGYESIKDVLEQGSN